MAGFLTAMLPERYTPSAPARDNLRQPVLLRAIAIAGQIITPAFVNSTLDIPLPLLPLAAGIGFLALFNPVTWLRLGLCQPVCEGQLFEQILVDIAVLTLFLYFTGGAFRECARRRQRLHDEGHLTYRPPKKQFADTSRES